MWPAPEWRRAAGAAWLTVGLGLMGCGSPCGPTRATVARAIDGDTVELADGQKVRYLNINAPESTAGKNECFGTQAHAENASRVEGKEVSLRYDVECTDKYGRLLAWLTADGKDVNLELVRRGYACAYTLPPGGESRRDEFDTLEVEARSARAGLWGVCTEVKCRD